MSGITVFGWRLRRTPGGGGGGDGGGCGMSARYREVRMIGAETAVEENKKERKKEGEKIKK